MPAHLRRCSQRMHRGDGELSTKLGSVTRRFNLTDLILVPRSGRVSDQSHLAVVRGGPVLVI